MNLFELLATIRLDGSDYERGLGRASDLTKSVGGKIGSALGTAAKVGAAALGVASGAAVGFAKSSVDVGMTFDRSMSQVAATMGYSVEELNKDGSEAAETFTRLRDFAQEMGAKTAFSASESADALNYMALAGYDAETSISMLPNVLNLAAAGSMDLARASDMITDSQSALGLSIEETSALVDKMAKTASKSNTSVEQLGEAILTVGGTAKSLSGGTTELATALGILADNGIKGAEGGTALRNVMQALIPKSEAAAEAWEEMGISAYDAEGNMRPLGETMKDMSNYMADMSTQDRQKFLSTIFNVYDLKSANALLAAAGDQVSAISVGLENSGVAWEKYADKVWASNGAVDGLLGEVQDNLLNLHTSAEELEQFLQFEYDLDAEDAKLAVESVTAALENQENRYVELSGYIDDAAGAAKNMADTQQDNLTGDLTIMKSALEGVQIAVADRLIPTLREFVQVGTQGLSDLAVAIKEDGLGGAVDVLGPFIENAVGMVMEGLPKFIEAGAKILIAIVDGIIQNLPALAEGCVKVISSLAEQLIASAPEMLAKGAELLQFLVDGIVEGLPSLAEGAAELMRNLGQYLQENLPTLIENGLQMILALTESIRENAGVIVDGALALIKGLAKGLIDSIPILIENVPTIISNIANVINDNAPKMLVAAAQIMLQLGIGLIKAIPTLIVNIPKIFEAIFNVWTAFNWINLGATAITKIGDGIKSLATKIPAAIKDIISTAGNIVKNFGWSSLGRGIIISIQQGISALTSAIPNLLRTIGTNGLNAFRNLNWAGIGKAVIDGIISGIARFGSGAINAVKGLGKSMIDGAKNVLGIHSPSKVFAEIGGYMAEGLGDGWDKEYKSVERSITDGLIFGVPTATVASAMPALAGSGASGGIYGAGGGYWNMDALAAALSGITVVAQFGTDTIESMAVQAIDRRNVRSGGR